MDWQQGYSARWRVDRVDPLTWEPCAVLPGIEGIEVDRDGTDAAPLLETCTMTATLPAAEPFVPGWHRITMEAVQGRVSQAVAISTQWLAEDGGTYDRGYREIKLTGRSALHQAADTPIGDGAYAPKGADGAAWAADQLRGCIDAPVHVEGGFELPGNVVFDLGASVLQAVWAVLKPNGWRVRLDGRGEVHIEPMPTEPALALDRAGSTAMLPKTAAQSGAITYTREWADDVVPFSVVRGAAPERGLDGLYRVQSQKITCAAGALVEETVVGI